MHWVAHDAVCTHSILIKHACRATAVANPSALASRLYGICRSDSHAWPAPTGCSVQRPGSRVLLLNCCCSWSVRVVLSEISSLRAACCVCMFSPCPAEATSRVVAHERAAVMQSLVERWVPGMTLVELAFRPEGHIPADGCSAEGGGSKSEQRGSGCRAGPGSGARSGARRKLLRSRPSLWPFLNQPPARARLWLGGVSPSIEKPVVVEAALIDIGAWAPRGGQVQSCMEEAIKVAVHAKQLIGLKFRLGYRNLQPLGARIGRGYSVWRGPVSVLPLIGGLSDHTTEKCHCDYIRGQLAQALGPGTAVCLQA